MPLQKNSVNINFYQGLDLKTDDKQVPVGRFLSLQNSIFSKGGLLQKRNGFSSLTTLPDTSYRYLTTFNGSLTALGQSLSTYSQGSNSWINKGSIQPLQLNVLPVARSSFNQTQADAVIAANNLACIVYTEIDNGSSAFYYKVVDYTTGQNIITPTPIVASGGAVVFEAPRVFLLGNYFVILFSANNGGSHSLQYLSVLSSFTSSPNSAVSISSSYIPSTGTATAYDGVVASNGNLYIASNDNNGGSGGVKLQYLSPQLVLSPAQIVASGHVADVISVCSDNTNMSSPIIWISLYGITGTAGYAVAVGPTLITVLAATSIITSGVIKNIASTATAGVLTFFYEVANNYGYDSAIPTDYIKVNTLTQAGSLGTAHITVRSLGLASKSFMVGNTLYYMAAYSSSFQPTYFLMQYDPILHISNIASKLAYSNGGGYVTTALPNVSLDSAYNIYIAYLFRDLIQAANKAQGNSVAGIYSQTGVNLAIFNILSAPIASSEIGNNLNISGGFLWAYDGNIPVEQNFHLWPDSVEVTTATGSGGLTAQQYFYQAVYQWTDLQGNIFQSAPSVPSGVVTTTGSSTNTIYIPTLRLTYKTLANGSTPVKIVLYRWSTAQQNYYQVTSIAAPLLNDTSVDYVSFTDTQADSAILGNSLIYTTGGVVEDIAPPATSLITLFKNRLFLVDAEDRNLLWYSKQVIESTPVEMSDLFTIFVAPTTAAQGNTGPITALTSMDDKLIIFKKNAIYYITGTGPDNTGASNDFSDPIYISGTVGCTNQNSLTLTPNGVMFQSDKGIWLLGRDLSTSYIGAPVEGFNTNLVISALTVPGTNQVRFGLNNGITLMYDYFYNQWGTFVGIPSISNTLYQNLHTFINVYGQVLQESLGSYMDGANSVLIKFTTSWLNLAGLQGYERAYYFYLLGTYISPHVLTLQIAYDYNPSATQSTNIYPTNFSGTWGSDSLWGGGPSWGGYPTLEQWRVFLQQQKCQAFQITLIESFDASFGTNPGAGFTLSGIDLVIGGKDQKPRLKPTQSVG